MAKSKNADYKSFFARNLREMLDHHPVTDERTTYGKLGEILGVKPQSVSLWANGETTPDLKHIVPIANYFGVDCNLLLTGVSAENQTMWDELGLHENSVRFLKDIKKLADKNEVNSMAMVLIADLFFRSGALMRLMDMLNQYTYDCLESRQTLDGLSEELQKLEEAGASNTEKLKILNRQRLMETNTEFIWFKSAFRANDMMKAIVDRAGGLEQFEKWVLTGHGRIQVVPLGFEDLSDGRVVAGTELEFYDKSSKSTEAPPS